MGEIKDILDSIKEIKGGLTNAGIFTTKRSIASRALDGTAEFPVCIDDSIPLEDAVVISGALERKFASFLLTTLTMNPYLEMGDGGLPSASDYVKTFHQNMRIGNPANIGVDLAKLEDAFESTVAKYDLDYRAVEEAAMIVAAQVFENVHSAVADRYHNATHYTIEAVTNPVSLNDLGRKPILEVSGSSRGKGSRSSYNSGQSSGGNTGRGSGNRGTNTNVNVNPKIDARTTVINQQTTPTKKFNNPNQMLNHSVDAKFEKANATVPTMLHIRVYPIDPNTKEQAHDAIDFVLGVKAVLHPIPADTLISALADGINGSNTFLDFVKWTTGETKFFKDFLFAVDQQKADAVSYSNPAKNWLIASKRRGTWAKVQNKFSKNALYPITTIVISNDSIEVLKEIHGYDLDKAPKLIDFLMKTYYLLGFVKVNTATQRVDIYMDGSDGVETVTLSTLSKEGSLDDRKFKDMMRMIGRSV